MQDFTHFLGLGIAGNFALHLDQAGEAEEFKHIITADEAAPKGMFPFYLPNYTPIQSRPQAKNILSTYPLSTKTLQLPQEKCNVQAEPEVALICKLTYENKQLIKITPTHFGAYNDCSIRVSGADKISDKKNWGACSKGLSQTLIKIDSFTKDGIMDSYKICSFLKRDGVFHAYGEDVALQGYSYFHDTLTQWMKEQINTQKDFGPLEPLSQYIEACDYPTNAIISIGATRYTEYGEKTFLQSGDLVFVVLYKEINYSLQNVLQSLKEINYDKKDMSILVQEVI